MRENFFDVGVAEHYDDPDDEMFSPEVLGPTVDLLAELADGQAALELAIGTGRVALPLSERGVPVQGIELSQAMVDQLRAKPGAERIEVAVGDMTSTRVEGRFGLVFLVFNTIGNVTSQDDQVAVFENAAAHLERGGRFLIEVGVPHVGERFVVFDHTDGHVGVDEHDAATQLSWSHHYSSTDGEIYRRRSIPFRKVWPTELDLMARIAGMELESRWADWDRSPFTDASAKHVSVWRRR
ncbi:methyltransferase domain-containing protein [Nocardioides sp. MAH-18]|uniref:Methyltransferase domain-containing protein n=1 Tax=Nocardioides agri TaxID=2682843 RepID=A0A6L6XKM4_9ACTN|nr:MULTISPECIES: class I SAM-dependent methyltransferase [unclassified Nocardioides]MBA2956590.1 class I SAM-dependent methyltransferase [Nocardioides sp. CGMCC 1.13656]MVQ47734.1 methyltransferase domain-containing protein [Nocardioides sp. MAH-18]